MSRQADQRLRDAGVEQAKHAACEVTPNVGGDGTECAERRRIAWHQNETDVRLGTQHRGMRGPATPNRSKVNSPGSRSRCAGPLRIPTAIPAVAASRAPEASSVTASEPTMLSSAARPPSAASAQYDPAAAARQASIRVQDAGE
jgi:hypothetical protein